MNINNYSSNENQLLTNFIYNDKRICAKLYVFSKFIGLIFYTVTLPKCYNPDFYIGMIVAMFLSLMNSVRYEYAHIKRYGTLFSSIIEYNYWKKELLPKSKMFFEIIELSIKIAYLAKIFPPQFYYNNLCEIGESIFKIHILVLFCIYIISGIFSIALLCMINYNDYSRPVPIVNQHYMNPFLIPIILNNNQTEECCICLDDNIYEWSILPCGHKYHTKCVSEWLNSNQTCPICRISFQ